MSFTDKQRRLFLKTVPDAACGMWRSLGPVLGALALAAVVLVLPEVVAAWADAKGSASARPSGAQRR